MLAISKSWWYLVMFGSPSLFCFSRNNVHDRIWLHRCSGRNFYLCKFKGFFTSECILICARSSYRTIFSPSATTQLPLASTTEENQVSNLLNIQYVLGFLGKAFKQSIFVLHSDGSQHMTKTVDYSPTQVINAMSVPLRVKHSQLSNSDAHTGPSNIFLYSGGKEELPK